jgi:putative transposase
MWFGFPNAGGKPYMNSSESIWGKFLGCWPSKRKQNIGRTPHARPRSVAGLDSTKVWGFPGCRFHQRQSAIHIGRVFQGRQRNFNGQSFWARGFFVSTVDRDEKVIREYIKKQEAEDRRLDQLQMF